MPMKTIMRRILVLAAAMLLLAVSCATAENPAAAGESAPWAEIKAGDVLCFGTPDEMSGFGGRWLVLDPAHTNTGEAGMFLVSLDLVGSDAGDPLLFRDIGDVSVSFSDRGEAYAAEHPGTIDYQGSDIQQWCAAFAETRLSEAERQALLPTFKSDEAIVIPGLGIPLLGTNGTVDFDPAENVLSGDRVFLLSVEEAANPAYGFTDDRSRVALFKGEANGYWLRSPHIPTFPLDVGFVFPFGKIMDYPVSGKSIYTMNTYARPACSLDLSGIAAAERMTASGKTVFWRLTMQGGEPNTQSYDLSLPEVGPVLDLNAMLRNVLIIAALVLAALIGLIVWLVVRKHRKRSAK